MADDDEVITPALLRRWPLPVPGEGKESRGHVLVVAGTTRTPGAAVLAAIAAVRAGAGKLTIATTAPTATHVAVAVPESLVEPLPATRDGHVDEQAADAVAELADSCDVVVLGTGLLDDAATLRLLHSVSPRLDAPLVLDATAASFLADAPDGVRHLEGRAVLTVNPKELASVADCSVQDVTAEPQAVAHQVADRCGVVVLLGATEKHVVHPDGTVWTYPGGGAGLGVSGSGDVQAGIVGGLLARGADAAQSAVWGAYVHARVGERLAAETGVLGHLAREQPSQVPSVLAELA